MSVFSRVLESDNGIDTLVRLGPTAAMAVVTCLFASSHLLGSQLFQLLLRAITVVGIAGFEQLISDFLVPIKTLRKLIESRNL